MPADAAAGVGRRPRRRGRGLGPTAVLLVLSVLAGCGDVEPGSETLTPADGAVEAHWDSAAAPGVDVDRLATQAVSRVERLWGEDAPDPSRPVRLVLSESPEGYVTDSGGGSGPAVTITRPGAVPLVVLSPDAPRLLTEEGLQGLLTHEFTHVAQRAGGGEGAVPLWLSEGSADLTAHGADRTTLRRLVGDWPGPAQGAGLPSDRQVREDAAVWGYVPSWTLAAFLADHGPDGAAGVVALERAVRSGTPLHEAMPETIGLDLEEVAPSWRAWVRGLLDAD